MLRREVFPSALRLEPLRLRCVKELLKLPAAATVHAPLLFYAPRSPFLPPSRLPTPLFSLWCLLTLSLAVAQTFYLLKKNVLLFLCNPTTGRIFDVAGLYEESPATSTVLCNLDFSEQRCCNKLFIRIKCKLSFKSILLNSPSFECMQGKHGFQLIT